MTTSLNQAAISAHNVAAIVSAAPGFDQTMETVFMASEENKLSPFRVYVMFEQTLGAQGKMDLLPVPGTEESYVKDGVALKRNLWDKFKVQTTNAKGTTITVPASFYGKAFDDTPKGESINKHLAMLGADAWDKEGSEYTGMTNKGDRDTVRNRMSARRTLGIKMFRTAGALYHQLEAFKTIETLKVSFVKNADGTMKFTPEPIRVIDNSDPLNGSLGNVKYFSVNGFLGLDADAIKASDDKWKAVTAPKARAPRAGGNETGKTVAPVKTIGEWFAHLNEMVSFMGEPGDIGKDSFYAKSIAFFGGKDTDDELANLAAFADMVDGLTTAMNDRVLRIRANRAATKEADKSKAA